MTARWFEPKHAYVVAKLDCMVQRQEALGSCTLEEMHEFVKVFRTLPRKHQARYAMLLDIMGDMYAEEEQPCE